MTASSLSGKAAAALAVLMLALPAQAEDATGNTVIATVNGTDITLGRVIALRESLPENFQALDDQTLFDAISEQLIQQELLAQTVTGLTARDDANIANARLAYLAGVAMNRIADDGTGEEALRAAYEEHIGNMEPATEYRAAHILVDTEDEARALKARLDDGADFAELARETSTDAGSAAAGGDLGWFQPEQMVAPFADAVRDATEGTVTAPVKSDFGWHLILVQEHRKVAGPTFEEARPELAAMLEREAVTAAIDDLTREGSIERAEEPLDPALIRDGDLID